MNIQDFKEIYKDEPAVKKVRLMLDAMNMVTSASVSKAQCHDPESHAHYRREIEGQMQRVEWLYSEIVAELEGKPCEAV